MPRPLPRVLHGRFRDIDPQSLTSVRRMIYTREDHVEFLRACLDPNATPPARTGMVRVRPWHRDLIQARIAKLREEIASLEKKEAHLAGATNPGRDTAPPAPSLDDWN